MADNPAQGIVDTINQQVMTPARKGMEMMSNALDPASYQFLLDALMKLKGGQPTAQAAPSRGDIYLPPESGQFDPMTQAAHLPPEIRQRMVADALRQRMSTIPTDQDVRALIPRGGVPGGVRATGMVGVPSDADVTAFGR